VGFLPKMSAFLLNNFPFLTFVRCFCILNLILFTIFSKMTIFMVDFIFEWKLFIVQLLNMLPLENAYDKKTFKNFYKPCELKNSCSQRRMGFFCQVIELILLHEL
jgi:hypothetical protein